VDDRITVGVLGATGTVGQSLIRLLDGHPWFRLAEVSASASSTGQTLGDRAPGSTLSAEAGALPLRAPDSKWDSPILLSALPSGAARDVETRLAEAGHLVVSNASAHRMRADVPLLIPEVNADHLEMVEGQPWDGALVTNPNCAVSGLAMALAPLNDAFGIERVLTTSFQAISGAGTPGPPAGSLLDNVLPFIEGEEEKLAQEPQKILGTVSGGVLAEADFTVSASCTRVSVSDGHLLSVSVALTGGPSPEQVAEAIEGFQAQGLTRELPTSPEHPLRIMVEQDRPQPRLDRDLGRGMTVTVGRIRPCEVLDVKFFVLSHNLVRGAAGAALLNAELCKAAGITEGLR
jgi:aspartate-semialdehyde dehydrogenase